jgi:hypothetical protein
MIVSCGSLGASERPAADPGHRDAVELQGLDFVDALEGDGAVLDLGQRAGELAPAPAVPVLPGQQLHDGAHGRGHADDQDRVLAHLLEARIAQVERALHVRHAAEDLEALGATALDERRLVGVFVADLRVAADDAVVRDEDVVARLEDHRLLAARGHRGDGRAGGHPRGRGLFDQLELQQRPCRLRRLQSHPHQVQERDVVLVGDLVQSIDDHLGHPREQLDHRDAGSDGLKFVHSGQYCGMSRFASSTISLWERSSRFGTGITAASSGPLPAGLK